MHLSRVRRVLGRWVRRETYRCMRLAWPRALAAAAAVPEPLAPIEVRPLARAELERHRDQVEYDFSPRFLGSIARRDDLCVGAFAGGRLASYCFFALMPTDIDAQLRFHFPERWIYVYKAFTHPDWRGRRLQQQVFLRAVPEVGRWLQGPLEPLGFVTLVMTENPSSFSAFSRLGFAPFESFPVLRIRSRPRLVSPPEDERKDFYIAPT